VVVIQVVICGCLCEDVKSFNGIEVGAFFSGCVGFARILVCCQMRVVVLSRVESISKFGCCIGPTSPLFMHKNTTGMMNLKIIFHSFIISASDSVVK
jgi:hypothetical protein